MSFWKKSLLVIALASLSGPLAAQSTAQMSEAEKAARAQEIEVQMREAEQRLEEAAQRIAELSASQLARAGEYSRRWAIEGKRPMIGITIGTNEEGEVKPDPVEGVHVDGITPGGAAEEVGLSAGDVITAVNGESLSADNANDANMKLLDFMAGVEEGDVLDIEYLRNGRTNTVELTPKPAAAAMFDFNFGNGQFSMPVAPQVFAYKWAERHGGHGFGEMEMVELNEDLGRYFGTDSGLLIVKAPKDNAFQLKDGDVIKSIDGREPKDLHHAVRILSSYETGEKVNIEIMRDRKKQTVSIEIPDNRHSSIVMPTPAAPAATVAPAPEAAPAIAVSPSVPVVPDSEERT